MQFLGKFGKIVCWNPLREILNLPLIVVAFEFLCPNFGWDLWIILLSFYECRSTQSYTKEFIWTYCTQRWWGQKNFGCMCHLVKLLLPIILICVRQEMHGRFGEYWICGLLSWFMIYVDHLVDWIAQLFYFVHWIVFFSLLNSAP